MALYAQKLGIEVLFKLQIRLTF